MEDNELECKLKKIVEGMGQEVGQKFKKEVDPIYKIINTMVIFGFLTVVMIMGTYISINYMQMNSQNKIVYVDKIIKEKVYIEVPAKEKKCRVDKTKGMKFLKIVKRNGREYWYYSKTKGRVWEFYTVAVPVKSK